MEKIEVKGNVLLIEKQINYKQFDELSISSGNFLLQKLEKNPLTYKQIAEVLGLDRTSVFYHIKKLISQKKVEKRFLGRICYIGIPKYKRK